ncbi:MAG: twin-arginine translocase TatA/TatE family subunit [Candidatus Methylarchaceae archaeon HK02M2]|nr:twin-arginine translocase TatA/TatE family subunit [Candidatus Methylarchaceae archaeon HK02M2]
MQGFNEILIIAIVAIVLLFGAKKVPEMARAFGRAKGEFERGKQEIDKELKEITKTPSKKEETEREKLIKAANSLGINTQGKTDEQLREEIQAAINKE